MNAGMKPVFSHFDHSLESIDGYLRKIDRLLEWKQNFWVGSRPFAVLADQDGHFLGHVFCFNDGVCALLSI